jgi:hypothetical protein
MMLTLAPAVEGSHDERVGKFFAVFLVEWWVATKIGVEDVLGSYAQRLMFDQGPL